jgi:hypothetical protein
MSGRRQRGDGTWTYATEEWDDVWYWPIGTRVSFRGEIGTVTKTNPVSVRIALDAGRVLERVSVKALRRLR